MAVIASPPLTEKVAILDCGAQYTKVIDRRIRELNVATEIFPVDVAPEALQGFSAIILSGGPNSVYEDGAPRCNPDIFALNLPVLGICYGMQLISLTFGGTVQSAATREYGETEIHVHADDDLFHGLADRQQVLMSHGDSVQKLAPGFRAIGDSHGIIAAIAHPERKIYGVQFHPEVELTENGSQMLANFLYRVCGLTGNFVLEDRLEASLQEIRERAGTQPVFVLVSGGVDSTVTAALLLRALGPERVYAVHIDSGLMRHEESNLVCDALKALGLKHLRRMDAEADFLNGFTEIDGQQVGPLSAITDPEAKRQIIGDVFYRLINQALRDVETQEGVDLSQALIAQGTLRPDLIESGNRGVSAIAQKIKTHHNDVPLIREQREKGLIIEPNRDWHKDEVRQVGKLLGLPEALVMRQPFPGPGLGVRILCAERPFVTEAHDAVQEALVQKASSQGFQGLLLPVQSVGVQGDGRSYSYLAALAGPYEGKPWSDLRDLARDIPNTLHAINRVALVLNQKSLPDALKTITPTTMTPETIALLRGLDHQVTQAFDAAGLLSGISQLLTVLVPVDTENRGRHSVAIRAVVTSDYMTARPATLGREIPLDFLQGLVEGLSAHPGVDLVMYDITSKPPATVEWE